MDGLSAASYTLNNTTMNIDLKSGKYVVAVSGGMDSMVLLHLLVMAVSAQQSATSDQRPAFSDRLVSLPRLLVAHFDHGIRGDSGEDRKLVQATAQEYGLPFVYDEGLLGQGVSEATARAARYKFLRQVQQASGAQAIITAHHQDDLLETAILNLIRGTGRKGLTALSNRSDIVRPLLHVPKSDLLEYARKQQLRWHEDSTNQDQTYLRNYIRHNILLRFDAAARQQLYQIILRQQNVNRNLDTLLVNQLHTQSVAGIIDRQWFNQLPHAVAKEIIATWLRAHDVRDFDSKSLERLVVAAKVAQPGKVFPLLRGYTMTVGQRRLALIGPER